MIHNFEKFNEINEASRSKIEKVQGMFEDMVEEKFIKDLFGDKTLYYGDDYELDSDTGPGPDGPETTVWIEIKGAKPEALKALDKDYAKFAKPFEDWCKKNDLYDANVTTPDPNDEDSIIFQITL